MKKEFDTLVLEVTRRCNMNCEHCMRGEAENLNMTKEIVDNLLSETASIGNLTFTGGEPTLNIEIIQYTLDECKRKNIPVYSFFIATNGKQITEEFVILCLRWYSYCMDCGGDPECSSVTISSDMFHEALPLDASSLISGLSFFSKEMKTTDFDRVALLNLGRARELTGFNKRDPVRSEELDFAEYDETMAIYSIVCITAAGDILLECDYEYDETESLKIGDVFSETDAILEKAMKEVSETPVAV